MTNEIDARLARLRGQVPARAHNARTIAALTTNPGCARRAVLDAAGIDKDRLAAHIGFPARFGQSQFAITRGNAFEAQVKASGYAELLRLLRETLQLDLAEVAYADLESAGGNDTADLRHARARTELTRAAQRPGDASTLFDHPLLRFEVAGRRVYLEPDLVAFRHRGVFHVVEIKSFPVIDGQADPAKVAAAATQSAVYLLALRHLLGDDAVSHDVVLVCPQDFSNRACATRLDVRKQLIVLGHQLARLARIDTLLDALPDRLSLDLAPDAAGHPTRPVDELTAALDHTTARYTPDCLSHCELAFYCRTKAAGTTATLGTSVIEELGGVASVAEALGLADGSLTPDDGQVEAAQLLRTAARLYAETAPGPPLPPVPAGARGRIGAAA